MTMVGPSHVAKQMADPGDVVSTDYAKLMAEHDGLVGAPLKMVGRKLWSPRVYRALQLLGNPLEVAWKQAFVRTLTFD